ncbi:MAG: hypothetical protein JWL81_1501 [Verrucomicrobiales bacterium]|nr:hypothetical protein [Verrucomicrobiales bacterium]
MPPIPPSDNATAPPPASRIDTAALMSIRSLELRARAVVEGYRAGLHRSPWHGFSVEFTEYRQYTPGDDLRHLDWRVYGRSDRYYIRKFEDETNLRCHLIVDQSHSMDFGTVGWTKAAYAATLAATLARFLHLQGDAVGLLSFDDQLRDYLPARQRVGHLRQIIIALDKPPGGRSTDLIKPLQRTAEIIRRRALLVLVSDFLTPLDELEKNLISLTATGHEAVLFQVLDPAEISFGFSKASVFEDAETGRALYIDPAVAREGYLQKFHAHQDALAVICNKLGAAFHPVSTERPLEFALTDFFQDRLRRGRLVRRGAR